MSAPRRRPLLAAIVATALALALLSTNTAQPTAATWTDREHGSSTVTALRLQPPPLTLVSCQRPPLVGTGDVLVLDWRWASGTPTATTAAWRVNSTARQPTTSTGGSGVHRSRFSSNLLSGVVGNLLGATFTVDVETTWTTAGGVVWRSPTRSQVAVSIPPLLGAPTCTVTNGS